MATHSGQAKNLPESRLCSTLAYDPRMTFVYRRSDGEFNFQIVKRLARSSDRQEELRVHVNRQAFADSYGAIFGEIVPVADRADAGVVVRGDGVQGVALLNPMHDTDRLRIRGCGAS